MIARTRKSPPRLFLWLAAALWAAQPSFAGSPGFVLEDHLNRTWRNEAVRFPLIGSDLKSARAGKALLGPDGKATLYQIVPGGSKREPVRIEFVADLDPFEKRTYAFTGAASDAQTDLRIEETDDLVRVVNGKTGISIRKKLDAEAGPIEAVRLNSGKWVGGSHFAATNQPLASYAVEITARGPVFAEVVCRAMFADNRAWTIKFRVQAREPVVLVDETFSVGEGAQWIVSLGTGFDPDGLFFRESKRGKVTVEKFGVPAEGPATFTWEPWLHWWSIRHGKWFSLYNEQGADLLMVGARDADVWVDPKNRKSPAVTVAQRDSDIVIPLPLQGGRRHWMLGALAKDACLASLKEKELIHAPLPQQYVIKQEFPLDRVKDQVLHWKATEPHPRLYVTAGQARAFRKTYEPDPDLLAKYLNSPLTPFTLDGPIEYYLGTGDPQLGRRFAETAVQWMQNAVDMYLRQEAVFSFGFAPHHQTAISSSLGLADAVLPSDHITAEERDRIRSQAAFLGYTVTRPDYWSPERGYAANPNMTTFVAGYQAAIGCFLASHPMSRAWVNTAMKELKDEQLETWSDSNGGWLEAPTYAFASYNYLFASFLMTYNSGFNDNLFHPRMKKIAEWLAKISTPPDARLKGWRHIPALGNTWKFNPATHFGTIASVWKKKDPVFASHMAWMFQQQGSYPSEIGGFSGTIAAYRRLILDTNIVARAPVYGSELFPKTGVVLRNHYNSGRETMLHLIQGDNHLHYDHDSGSITVWGKGRIIADEFGYYGQAPVEDHSMVESPVAGLDNMHVTEFEPGDRLDYVRGKVNGWTRQIAFVKDADPLGPNYFVVHDGLQSFAPATWRLWLTCSNVVLGTGTATVVGNEDVDTDIFFARPSPVALKTEPRTRSTSGLNTEAKYDRWDWTQIGLIATEERSRGFATVIYPRLKTEKPPLFTSLAEGRAVKVVSDAGTDYVFLSDRSFQFREGEIEFEGTAGAVQMRGTNVFLSLGSAGKISARGQSLRSGKAAVMNSTLIENGDFESDAEVLAAANPEWLTVRVHKGDPVPSSHARDSTRCLWLRMEQDSTGSVHAVVGLKQRLFIDPTRTYRLGVRAFTDTALMSQIGGYGWGGPTGQTQVQNDKGAVWGYYLHDASKQVIKGPLPAWQSYEITIGPAGSAADFHWAPGTVWVNLGIRIWGKKGDVLYLDDFILEEVEAAK